MHNNISPWLHQLKVTRSIDRLDADLKTDVAVVGAGIAGVMTAYFILKNTNKQVLLIEGGKVAHGATGHNAGQIVFEFEEEFSVLAERYGLEKAADAERLVRGAWILLEEIYQDANLSTPMSSFMGYNGYASIDRLMEELRNNLLRVEAGLQVFPIYIAEDAPGLENIPKEYAELYSLVPHDDVLALLESKDRQYIAVISERKGCVNAAMLIEEIVGYLLSVYKGRFTLFEESFVDEVILEKEYGQIISGKNIITADKVVLCTNGFENFKITNKAGSDIDVKFHHMVKGDVGYMAAYLEEMTHPPIALQFHDSIEPEADKPAYEKIYYYLTRRPFEIEKDERHNLICVGGPETHLESADTYESDGLYMEEAAESIENFIHRTHKGAPKGPIEFKYKWHGLMGYTPTGLRVVGEEPKNRVLMYNIGCNGVGILTSIYGSLRISQIVRGDTLESSVFDPKDTYEAYD
ncbi:MAG: FAD-binding oxidoreductase [Candidatus Taylorbacteria bacterium]|nr:FAD-binding oxidoreductase [Candidatus Taylorbacteria bacterium]